MDKSKLKDHKWGKGKDKGKLITPMNSVETITNDSWVDNRLPEYLWIGIILNSYDRKEGFQKIYQILEFLHVLEPKITLPCLSEVLSLEPSIQARFFQKVVELTDVSILEPLTLILTYDQYPVFAQLFTHSMSDIKQKQEQLLNIISKLYDHQSNESTDIRFCVTWMFMGKISKKLILLANQLQTYDQYIQLEHSNDKMSHYRAMIRASEIGVIHHIKEESDENLRYHNEYVAYFWDRISKISDCDLRILKYDKKVIDITLYMEYLYEIFNYLTNCYIRLNPLDDKMAVILGMSIYSYKRLKEVCDFKLGTAIVAKGTLRVIIESYIMIKYLLQEESNHSNIWQEYQYYGLGSYKLVVAKWREAKKDDQNSMFDVQYIEGLVNEFRMEEFLDIDTRYFNNKRISIKAEEVGEKDLYDFYYNYCTSFEHSLWGAVRETSFIKCLNSAHKYHIIPDINNEISFKNIEYDCIVVMNQLIVLLNDLYGIPENLFTKVTEYEQYINQEN